RVFDAGNVLRGRQEPLAQRYGFAAVELHAAHAEIDQEDGIDVVAEPERLHVMQAAYEETGAHEKHDGKRTLEHEEHDARARPVIGALPRAGLEIVRELDAPRLPDWGKTGEQPGDDDGG